MPHGNQEVSDSRIISEFLKTSDPYLTATELADTLGMTRQGIHDRLLALHEDGVLERKKTGRTVGWWLSDRYSRSDAFARARPSDVNQ